MVSSFGARDILQQSSRYDATVSLGDQDRQRSKADKPGMGTQEQPETIDRALGSNNE